MFLMVKNKLIKKFETINTIKLKLIFSAVHFITNNFNFNEALIFFM